MALQDLLDLSQNRKKIGLSEERIRAIIPAARDYISFWREYPDLFVDFMKGQITTSIYSSTKEYLCVPRCAINMFMQFSLVLIQNHSLLL